MSSRLYMFRAIFSLVYTQEVFVILLVVLLASASVVILTTLADANRTSMYCVYTVLRYSWWWTVDMSETCRVL